MGPDTVSPTADPAPQPSLGYGGSTRALPRRRNWRVRGVSLTTRILAVNVIALALLAGSFFYLDSYRKQLLAERFKLARAFSDMTTALRLRIDAVESFAADVAHELKNPLASLSSALETMERIEDPALRSQLAAIAAHDVQRIDRLITEIAYASRIDAELSRSTFATLDLAKVAHDVIGARGARPDRPERESCPVHFTSIERPALVRGDALQLERVLENLLDNAVSFSPPSGRVEVSVQAGGGRVILAVRDDGPGIPPREREKVFERFHSVRPAAEAFGAHSGLGLAIARTIAEAHDGALIITDRDDGRPGAQLLLELPMAGEEEE